MSPTFWLDFSVDAPITTRGHFAIDTTHTIGKLYIHFVLFLSHTNTLLIQDIKHVSAFIVGRLGVAAIDFAIANC
jgi:hypothetical protein